MGVLSDDSTPKLIEEQTSLQRLKKDAKCLVNQSG